MRRNIVFAQLIIFALISVLIVSYTIFGVIGADPTADPIGVTVKLKTGGGVFEGSEVAYRGVGVGRVDTVELRPDSVTVRLTLNEGTKVPDNSTAHVYNLSVAGEQYVDLVPPKNASTRLLQSGDVIPAERTTTPIAVANVLLDIQRLVTSIDPADVRIVSRELAAAFANSGPELRQLLSSSTSLVGQLSDSKEAMLRLVENGRVVLDTVASHSSDFATFANSLRALTATLKSSTPTIERLIEQGPSTTRLVDQVINDNASAATVLMANLATFGGIQVANVPGLRALLVAVPQFGRRLPGVIRDGSLQVALLLNYSDRVCSYGVPLKSPISRQKSKIYQAGCSSSSTIPRGATNAPPSLGSGAGPRSERSTSLRPPARTTADRRTQVATYDPQQGLITTADGKTVRLGYSGGQEQLYGDKSWQTLLAPIGLSD